MNTLAALRAWATSSISGESLRAHWIRGAGGGLLLQVAGLILTFTSSIVVARLLGPEGLGHYSYALAIVGVLSVIASLGLPTVVTRLLPAYEATLDWGLARGLLSRSTLIIISSGFLFGIGVIAGAQFSQNGAIPWVYLCAAPLVLVMALANLRQRALQGLRRPLAAQLPEQFIKHSAFIAIVGILWLMYNQSLQQPQVLMATWLIASLVSLILGIALLHRLSPPALSQSQLQYRQREWFTIALPIFSSEVLTVVFANTDILLLGWMRPPEEVGMYQVSARFAGLLLIVLGASNWVLAPWFSRFYATKDRNRLQSVVTRTSRLIFSFTLGICLLLIFVGEDLLRTFFGSEFAASYPALLVLAAGQLVNVASGPVVNLLAMTGGQRELAWSVAGVAFVNIVLCILIIPIFGIIGAAMSVAISTSVYNLLLAAIVKKRIGIGATIFGGGLKLI